MIKFVLAPNQAIAVIVMIAFIMVCVFAPFGAAHAIVGLSTAAVTIIIAGLAAIGITFASNGGFDTLEDYVSSLLQDYATDQNIPVTSVFNGTQFGANAAGKLILNNRFVQLISGFANWLKVKYNLSNNSTVSLESSSMVNGLQVYDTSIIVKWNYSGSHYKYYFIEVEGTCKLVFYASATGGVLYVKPMAFSDSPFTIKMTMYDGNNILSGMGEQRTATLNNQSYFAILSNPSMNTTYFTRDNPDLVYYTNTAAQIKQYLDGQDMPEYDIDLQVGTIDIPTDRTGYSDTDGAVLDVSAPWSEPVSGVINTVPSSWDMVENDTLVYTLDLEAEAVLEEQLPHPSDIENLPGATIPGLPDIEDGEPWHLEFSNLWHYVAQWISDMSAGGAVIWNTCIQAPPAIINFVFAGIVLAMWFGAIKILR